MGFMIDMKYDNCCYKLSNINKMLLLNQGGNSSFLREKLITFQMNTSLGHFTITYTTNK